MFLFLFLFGGDEFVETNLVVVVFIVEKEQEYVDHIKGNANDAKILKHKIENVGQVDVA